MRGVVDGYSEYILEQQTEKHVRFSRGDVVIHVIVLGSSDPLR